MKKFLLVLSFLAVASLAASASNHAFGLSGFCDTFDVNNFVGVSGAPPIALGGTHDCTGGSFPQIQVGGFKHGLSSFYQYASTGAVYDVHDDEYLAWFGVGYQDTDWIFNLTYNTWVVYISNSGSGFYFVNFGTLTPGATPTGTKRAAQR